MARELTAKEMQENKDYAEANEGWSISECGRLVTPKGKICYLGASQLGQMKDPEVQAKMQAVKREKEAEAKKRKEAAATGFGLSKLADPDNQALLINKLYEMALDPDTKIAMQAMKMLSDMGVTKQPAEKPEADEPTKAENMSIEDATAILIRAQKEDADK